MSSSVSLSGAITTKNFFGAYPWDSHDDDTKLAIGGALLFIGNARVVVNMICSGMLDQSIIDEYCYAGELPGQIESVRAFYRGKRAVMLGALQEHFGGRAHWTDANGGLFTFMTLSDSIDTASRIETAVANGVTYVPGSPFFVDGSGQNTMRLTFAKESDERLREGVQRLALSFRP